MLLEIFKKIFLNKINIYLSVEREREIYITGSNHCYQIADGTACDGDVQIHTPIKSCRI